MNPVRVSIKNYQSIDSLDFEVSGFTTVTGKSNIGKSALLRAISGALLNKPVTNLVRTDAKSCSVRLSSDGWGLLWEKAEKGLNRYTIDGKAEKLENVGQRQPEQVASMGFSSVKIGDKDLYPWYASQWTPIFLLDEGGPTVTQFISEISGLNVLQNAISLGVKEKKKQLDDSKFAQQEADQTRTKLDKLDKLDELSYVVADLDKQAESILTYEIRIQKGKELNLAIMQSAASIRAIIAISSLPVPTCEIGNGILTVLKMKEFLSSLQKAAKSIIAIRGFSSVPTPSLPASEYDKWEKIRKYACVEGLKVSVGKLSHPICVPDAPESEYDDWEKVRRFSGIEELQKSVSQLEPICSVNMPDAPPPEDVYQLAKAKRILSDLQSARGALLNMQNVPPVPDSLDVADDMERMLRGKAILAEIAKLGLEVSKLSKDLKGVDKEFKSVQAEIDKIPACPTCNRPMHTEAVG